METTTTFDQISKSEKMIKSDSLDFDCKDNIEVFRKVIFEPIRIGPVSTLDEMDCKVLQFQNKKLEMKLQECQRTENELQQRIQQLEKRQSQDTTVLNIVNLYWNRLNDDIGAVLLDVDEEYENDSDNQIESEAALGFVNELSSWDDAHVDENLVNSVQISTAAMAKIIRAYDHILYKNDKTLMSMKQQSEEMTSSDATSADFNHEPDKSNSLFDNHSVHAHDRIRSEEIANDKDCCDVDEISSVLPEEHTSKSNHKHKKDARRKKKSSSSHKVTDFENETTSFAKNTVNNDFNEVTSKQKLSSDDVVEPHKSRRKHDRAINDDDSVSSDIKLLMAEIVNKISEETEVNLKENTLNDSINNDDSFGKDSRRLLTEERSEKSLFDRDRMSFFDERKFNSKQEEKSVSSNVSVLKELRNLCVEITHDNVRLQSVVNSFQNHQQKIIINEQDTTNALADRENEYEEWKTRVDEFEYENEKLKYKKFKIEHHLGEAVETLEKLKARGRSRTKSDSSNTGVKKVEEFEEELEMQRELVFNRSQELEALRLKYQSDLDTVEELEKNINELPEDVIEETTEYKCLQSQFSVLYNDTMLIKDQIEEYHAHIQTLNATFANKLEMTETEDLMTLRKLQTDLLQMQQVNSQLRREYQMLKIEFERNLIANEQTGPLNKEMRHLLTRLQKHNKHLKHEAQRYKRKYKELNAELNLLSKQNYDSKFKMESESGNSSDFDETDYTFDIGDELLDIAAKEEPMEVKKEKLDSGFDETEETSISLYDRPIMAIAIKQEPDSSPSETLLSVSSDSKQGTNAVAGPSRICSKMSRKRRKDAVQEYKEILSHFDKELRDTQEVEDLDEEKLSEDEYVLDLRNQLKKAESEQKELKLLLDMYKSVNRDKREKMQLLLAEKKLKADIEDTKAQMRRILEIKRENRKKLADEDALRKIKYLEEQNFLLLRQINVHKQEEEALLSEMEVTNQAFEDMQEQNSRLIQQLREKDDANSKLMAERIKSNLLYKITREEKESLQALINATSKQLDAVTTVMNELEEKEQIYQIAINNVEKEINLRQQALELHRKKTLEYTQCATELKHNFEKYSTEMKETKQQISEKSSTYHAEVFKHNRLLEEVAVLRTKMERMKKVETPETPDIVLVEEVREYKEILTCQSCKVRRKDAVLTKCFHVFCWECLRTRYETRRRKCPKCNATFGANDYHRLFFAN